MDWWLNYTGEQVKQEINHNWPADWQDWPLWSGSRRPPRQHGQCGVWWWTGSGHRWSWEEEKKGGMGRGGGGAGHFISRTLLALRRKTKASQIYIKELNQALQYKQTINWMYNRNVTDTWAAFWTMWLYRWWRPAKSLLWNNCEFCIM